MEVEVLKSHSFIAEKYVVSSEMYQTFSTSLLCCKKDENCSYSKTFLCLLYIKPVTGSIARVTSNHTAEREMVWAFQEPPSGGVLRNSSWPTAEGISGC